MSLTAERGLEPTGAGAPPQPTRAPHRTQKRRLREDGGGVRAHEAPHGTAAGEKRPPSGRGVPVVDDRLACGRVRSSPPARLECAVGAADGLVSGCPAGVREGWRVRVGFGLPPVRCDNWRLHVKYEKKPKMRPGVGSFWRCPGRCQTSCAPIALTPAVLAKAKENARLAQTAVAIKALETGPIFLTVHRIPLKRRHVSC